METKEMESGGIEMNTEITEGICNICEKPIYPGEARLTTLLYGLIHWSCFEDE